MRALRCPLVEVSLRPAVRPEEGEVVAALRSLTPESEWWRQEEERVESSGITNRLRLEAYRFAQMRRRQAEHLEATLRNQRRTA